MSPSTRTRHLLDQFDVPGGIAQRGRLALMADHRHGQRPAVARPADHLVGPNNRTVEFHLAEFGGDTVDHAQRALLDAGLVHGDDERRDALVPRHVRVGSGQQQAPVGNIGVAGPDLVAVDDVVLTVAGRFRAQRGQVRTGAGLAEALAPTLCSVDHPGQETALQLRAAVPAQAHHQVTQTGPRRGAGARQLLVDDHVVHRRQLVPAVLTRPRHPEEAGRIQRLMPLPLPRPVIVAGRREGAWPARPANRAGEREKRPPPVNHENPRSISSNRTANSSDDVSARRRYT